MGGTGRMEEIGRMEMDGIETRRLAGWRWMALRRGDWLDGDGWH